MRARGHIPDHPAVVARRTPLHYHPAHRTEIALMAAALPMATTNRAFLQPDKGGPGNLDQDGVGKCEGMAHGEGGTLFFAIRGESQGLISPDMLYFGGLLVDRTVGPDGQLSDVTDTGTRSSSILSGWQTFGAVLAKDDDQYPATQATLFVDPSNPNSTLKLPSIDKMYRGSPYRYKGAYFITSRGPQRTLDGLTTLAAKRLITNAIPASGPEFQNYMGGRVLGALSGPIDHANLIVDYTWLGTPGDWQLFTSALRNGDVSTSTMLGQYLIWHGDNSWGIQWGEGDTISSSPGGMYRADMDYYTQAEDLCVLDLEIA
jgi:hypothetical protein